MTIFLILVFFFIVALLDFVPLVRYKQKPTAIVFALIFISTLTLAILIAIDVKIPSLYILINDFLDLIGLHY